VGSDLQQGCYSIRAQGWIPDQVGNDLGGSQRLRHEPHEDKAEIFILRGASPSRTARPRGWRGGSEVEGVVGVDSDGLAVGLGIVVRHLVESAFGAGDSDRGRAVCVAHPTRTDTRHRSVIPAFHPSPGTRAGCRWDARAGRPRHDEFSVALHGEVGSGIVVGEVLGMPLLSDLGQFRRGDHSDLLAQMLP
jgi:hypothetical protein